MIKIQKDISLRQYNTFGIDVKARMFVQYTEADDLHRIFSDYHDVPYFHLGGGSNVLFTKDYDGMILHSQIIGHEILSENDSEIIVKVGSGVVWDDFVEYCVSNGWAGAENLSLIPGEVGASAVQNIGAYGAEVKDLIVSVYVYDVLTGDYRTIGVEECDYAYRNSMFKRNKNLIVTHVVYRLSKKFCPNISYGNIRTHVTNPETLTLRELRNIIIAIRNEKLPDPKVTGNAGSFFMNPVVSEEKFESLYRQYPDMPHYKVDGGVKIPAGWMIEQCGWKGRVMGNAGVHKNQALVLVNMGGAKAEDVVNLASAICKDVYDRFGIRIHPEVNYI